MKPYRQILMFSGGGSRLGYYLGCYAALVAQNRVPDAIVGSCGGSIAAWLVAQSPEPERLYRVMTSAAFYRAMQSVCVARQVGVGAWFQAAWRVWQTGNLRRLRQVHARDNVAILCEHLQQYALFESPKLPEMWLNEVADLARSLPNRQPCVAPDVLIAASRMCDLPENKLAVQQVWFVPEKMWDFWRDNPPKCGSAHHAYWRIVPHAHVCADFSFMAAVAASICDMYYQAPVWVEGVGWTLGAVLDLQPIEAVCDLADTVWAEHKPPYSALAQAAILRVFGADAHRRHAETARFQTADTVIHRLPFADNAAALRGNYAAKRWDWRSGCLKMDLGDHAHFVNMMSAQWAYGYTRTMNYCDKL